MRSGLAEVAMSPVRAKRAAKPTVLLLLAMLLLSLGTSRIDGATLSDNNTDVLALQDFKSRITSDPTGVLNTWNSSTFHCSWHGVTCSRAHPDRVMALKLPGRSFSGQISPSIGNLTFLRTLNLSENGFSGLLPPLNNLRKLQILALSLNILHGSIPDGLINCSSLKVLDLAHNTLVGEIPSKIGLLSNLSKLLISKNNLTGTIPPTLGNITHINYIDVVDNKLTGSIPYELGNLTELSELLLGLNSMSGVVPRPFFNLVSLRFLGLELNMLTGTALPSKVDLPNLQGLTLGGNMFSEGKIPASLGNSTRLEILGLSENNLTGQFPSFFGKLTKLQKLSLQTNNLEGRENKGLEFFHALTNCTDLKIVGLSYNRLQGVLPDYIGNLSSSLWLLSVAGNGLSGSVPSTIGNLRTLLGLGLGMNNLTSTIEWVGQLTNLQVISLTENKFIGQIPSSIGNLTEMSELNLANNELEGPIPPGLGNLGSISKLDLSNNNFHGNIPTEFSKFSQLSYLDLSSNNLTGEIPVSLKQCRNLVTVNMSQNILTGSIPGSLGNISGLITLNLSQNNLSGEIPKTLSGLQVLQNLDLSYNTLEGEIPRNGVFENASKVSLKGNLGLCGGPMVLHMPSCGVIHHRTKIKYYLIRVLIPFFGFMSLILLVYFLFLIKKMPRKAFSSPSFGEKFFQTVSYNDLAQATRNFSEHNLIGQGSYGSVYRGKLKEQKMEVAVKVFDLEMQGAERSFMSECEALRSIQHRNLLPIMTACSTVDNDGRVFKALVYEFMPNGSLDTWLHYKGKEKTPKRLGLTQIISIAVNTTDALDYLHNDCGRPTVHCDLKPSNILLDDDMTALLGDFGIARFYADPRSTSTGLISTVGLKGTIGYIAPEYAGGGHVSTSGDVYSFGIVLLEMMTGKRPTDPIFKDGLNIVNFVENSFPHQIFNVLDAHLTKECEDFAEEKLVPESALNQCLVSILQVALSCTHPFPSERMNMKLVASKMRAIQASYLGWKAKN